MKAQGKQDQHQVASKNKYEALQKYQEDPI